MNKRINIIIIILAVMFTALPQAEASIFSKALNKARKVMQGAFQMSFLSSVPVIFYKDSFNRMTDYVNDSIDNMNKDYNGTTITAKEFQDDKQTHIKKSAELALHIKSLTGSKYLAYGLTLLVGLTKEAIDGSFLNPNGGRCIEDFYADIVGAKAVFGEEAVDKALDKYMGSFIKEGVIKDKDNVATVTIDTTSNDVEINTTNKAAESPIPETYNEEYIDYSGSSEEISKEQQRQLLMQEYYKAAQKGDTEAVRAIAEQLNNL